MNRIFEAVFRRLFRLLAIVILVPLVSLAVAYIIVPRTYEAQASVWALHRYAVIGTTGLESNLQATPADTQSAALGELLQTRTFALSIAHATNLASTLNLDSSVLSNPAKLNDALYNEISQNVTVTSQGYNLYIVHYANRNPQVAQQVVAYVLNDFENQSDQFSSDEGQQLLEAYQTQLVKAQDAENQAAKAEAQYLSAHPGLSAQQLANDPQYQTLHAQTVQQQTNVQNIQNEISSIQQEISTQGSGSGSLFRIVDASHVLTQPVSRLKTYLYVGVISLVVALLACTLYLLVLIRRDRSIYTLADVQKITSLPVLMQAPHLPSAVLPRLVEAGASSRGELSAGNGAGNNGYLDY